MRSAVIAAIVTVVVIAAVTTTTTTITTTSAYAQPHYDDEFIVMRELDADSQRMISETISKLQNLINDTEKFDYVMLYDGGRVEIFWSDDSNENYTNTVYVSGDDFHNYTLDNGYEFRRDQIIKPDGTPLFP